MQLGYNWAETILILSSLYVEPKFRGNKTGYTILNAILATVGRDRAMVVLQATPLPSGDGPEEGTPERSEARAALRRYWIDYGFQEADGDYLVLTALSHLLNARER